MPTCPLSAALRAAPESSSEVKVCASNKGINTIDGGSATVRSLLLAGNALTSLAGVEGYPELRVLRVDGNLIRSLDEVRRLRRLKHLTNVWFVGCPVCGVVGYREAVVNAMYAEGNESWRIDGTAVTDAEVEDARNGLFLRKYFAVQLLWLHRLKERVELDAADRRPPAQWRHPAPVRARPDEVCGAAGPIRPTALLRSFAACFCQPDEDGDTDALLLHDRTQLALASPRAFDANDVAAFEYKLRALILADPRILAVSKADPPPKHQANAVFGVADPAVTAALLAMLQNMYDALVRAAETRAASLLPRPSRPVAAAPLHETLACLAAVSHSTVAHPAVQSTVPAPAGVPRAEQHDAPSTPPAASASDIALSRRVIRSRRGRSPEETDTSAPAAAIVAQLCAADMAVPHTAAAPQSPSLLQNSTADSYAATPRPTQSREAPLSPEGVNTTSQPRIVEGGPCNSMTSTPPRGVSPLAFIDVDEAPPRTAKGGAPEPAEGAPRRMLFNLRRVVETEHIVRHEDKMPRPNTKKAGLRLLSRPSSPVQDGDWLDLSDASFAKADPVPAADAAATSSVEAATRSLETSMAGAVARDELDAAVGGGGIYDAPSTLEDAGPQKVPMPQVPSGLEGVLGGAGSVWGGGTGHSMHDVMARYQQLQDLQALEQLKRLDDLERLRQLQRLRDLRDLADLDAQRAALPQPAPALAQQPTPTRTRPDASQTSPLAFQAGASTPGPRSAVSTASEASKAGMYKEQLQPPEDADVTRSPTSAGPSADGTAAAPTASHIFYSCEETAACASRAADTTLDAICRTLHLAHDASGEIGDDGSAPASLPSSRVSPLPMLGTVQRRLASEGGGGVPLLDRRDRSPSPPMGASPRSRASLSDTLHRSDVRASKEHSAMGTAPSTAPSENPSPQEALFVPYPHCDGDAEQRLADLGKTAVVTDAPVRTSAASATATPQSPVVAHPRRVSKSAVDTPRSGRTAQSSTLGDVEDSPARVESWTSKASVADVVSHRHDDAIAPHDVQHTTQHTATCLSEQPLRSESRASKESDVEAVLRGADAIAHDVQHTTQHTATCLSDVFVGSSAACGVVEASPSPSTHHNASGLTEAHSGGALLAAASAHGTRTARSTGAGAVEEEECRRSRRSASDVETASLVSHASSRSSRAPPRPLPSLSSRASRSAKEEIKEADAALPQTERTRSSSDQLWVPPDRREPAGELARTPSPLSDASGAIAEDWTPAATPHDPSQAPAKTEHPTPHASRTNTTGHTASALTYSPSSPCHSPDAASGMVVSKGASSGVSSRAEAPLGGDGAMAATRAHVVSVPASRSPPHSDPCLHEERPEATDTTADRVVELHDLPRQVPGPVEALDASSVSGAHTITGLVNTASAIVTTPAAHPMPSGDDSTARHDAHPQELLSAFWACMERQPLDLVGARAAATAAVRRALALEGLKGRSGQKEKAVLEGVVVAEDAALRDTLAHHCAGGAGTAGYDLDRESDVALSYQLLRDVLRNPTAGVMIEMELATIRSSLKAGAKLEEVRMVALKTLETSMRVLASSESCGTPQTAYPASDASLRKAHGRKARRTSKKKDRRRDEGGGDDSTLLDIVQNLSDAGVTADPVATAQRHHDSLLACKAFSKWKRQWAMTLINRAVESVRGKCVGCTRSSADVWTTPARTPKTPTFPRPVHAHTETRPAARTLSPHTVMGICKTPQPVASAARVLRSRGSTPRRAKTASKPRHTAPHTGLPGDRPRPSTLGDILAHGRKGRP